MKETKKKKILKITCIIFFTGKRQKCTPPSFVGLSSAFFIESSCHQSQKQVRFESRLVFSSIGKFAFKPLQLLFIHALVIDISISKKKNQKIELLVDNVAIGRDTDSPAAPGAAGP